MTEYARLEVDGHVYELPILEGTEGERAIDISKLRAESSLITLDDGFGNTGSCASKITFIDGNDGILRYRGIPIETLAEHSSFVETAYLLIFGHLPTHDEREHFTELLTESSEPIIYPRPDLRYVDNFLHMMFSLPYKEYEASPEISHALNMFLVLHADHEQNCSTSTVRMVASGEANLYASCSAGVVALWGPKHGGANTEVVTMLQRMRREGLTPQELVNQVKDKSNNRRLMGFGHRIYRNFDPRSKILRKAAERLLNSMKIDDPLLGMAQELADIALNDDYFIERHLYPNVDFYSGVILRAIGIPLNMYTVMFTMGRTPGWIANWKEVHDNPGQKIYRPRQLYVGNPKSEWVLRHLR